MLNEQTGLPIKLRDIGVREEHIEPLSDLALADFCHANNPKPVTRSDFKAMYLAAY
jgi:alcohol dehydrogenase class IV